MKSTSGTHLVEDLVKDILEVFDVSPEAAEARAIGILQLMDSHGSELSRSSGFSHILRLYGRELPWRSQAKRQEWLSENLASVAGYNAYLDSRRDSPFKKW